MGVRGFIGRQTGPSAYFSIEIVANHHQLGKTEINTGGMGNLTRRSWPNLEKAQMGVRGFIGQQRARDPVPDFTLKLIFDLPLIFQLIEMTAECGKEVVTVVRDDFFHDPFFKVLK